MNFFKISNSILLLWKCNNYLMSPLNFVWFHLRYNLVQNDGWILYHHILFVVGTSSTIFLWKSFLYSTKLLKSEMKSINSLKTKEKHFHHILNDSKNSYIVSLIMESPKLSYAKWHMKGLTIQLESNLKPCAKMILWANQPMRLGSFLKILLKRINSGNRFMSYPVNVLGEYRQ